MLIDLSNRSNLYFFLFPFDKKKKRNEGFLFIKIMLPTLYNSDINSTLSLEVVFLLIDMEKHVKIQFTFLMLFKKINRLIQRDIIIWFFRIEAKIIKIVDKDIYDKFNFLKTFN